MNSLIYKITTYWNSSASFFNNSLLIAFLLIIFMYASYIDIMYYKIYDKFNLFILFSRLIFVFIPIYTLPITLNNYIGAIIGTLALLIPAVMFMVKMGGDIKFIFSIGFFFEPILMLFLLIGACFYILIFSVIYKIKNKSSMKKIKIPMAPFFCLSFVTLLIISKI